MSIFLRLLLVVSVLVSGAAAQAACLPPDCTQFPADAGFVNVRDFGAKGDGITDDTDAIKAALTASGVDIGTTFWQDKIVYFPDGTYLVSAPITKRYAEGRFGSGSILMGQSRDKTIIRLKDAASGYNDPSIPQAVIFTSAKLLDGNATSGGKDYTNKGEGNDAYMNYVENLTVDTGKGNPGAIGIDYLANNMGAIRNVLVRGDGAVGIAITRKWPGPALLQDVTVQGFDIGIDAANTEYGVTLERITLSGQRQIGLRNNHNMLAIHTLNISNAPLALANLSPDGLMVVAGGTFTTRAGGEAIQNNGYLNLRSVKVNGYRTALGAFFARTLDGIYNLKTRLAASQQSWSLPIKDAPAPPANSPDNWVSVSAYGAQSDSPQDAAPAIRAALATGAGTIYFPHGVYLISDTIEIPASTQRIVGMTSTIRIINRSPGFSRDEGMFRTGNTSKPLIIEKLALDNSNLGDQVGVEAAGTRPVVLRDVVGAGVMTLLRPRNGGEAYVDNTCCGKISVAGSKGVWARQLDTEGLGARIQNNGAPLWILGLKTEQNCTAIDNSGGAKTELLGGLIYIVADADPAIPAFRNTDSKIALSYIEESFRTQSIYALHLVDTQSGKTTNTVATTLPLRTIGRMAPLITGR